jgi:hypothetical protein
MSITLHSGGGIADVFVGNFKNGIDDFEQSNGFDYSPTFDLIQSFVIETANDGSPDGAYASLVSEALTLNGDGTGSDDVKFDIPRAFFAAHVGTTIKFEVVLIAVNPLTGLDGQATYDVFVHLISFDPAKIQNDSLGITRTTLPLDQVTTEVNAINADTTTETQFVNDLLSQVANTTIPAVAVEGSMYPVAGTSDEITKLVTAFLPLQVANAIQNDFNPQVYACEALGLVFAFGNENGATTFDTNFGPSNPATRATPAGDAAFAAEAASAIFGSAATANTPGAIAGFVSNWVDFYTSHGVPGISNPTNEQIHLAARGAAWGDAVGVALANNLGPLPGQTTNFLEDAAQGRANYGASLASQPIAFKFEGASASVADAADHAQLIGIAASDHIVM